MHIIYSFNLRNIHLTYKIKVAFNIIIFNNLKAKIIRTHCTIAENKNQLYFRCWVEQQIASIYNVFFFLKLALQYFQYAGHKSYVL